MNNIRRHEVGWKIIHSFIKVHMLGDLDHMGFGVIPDDIFVSVGYET